MIKIRSWDEEQIINIYKWADGFHKVNMNRLQLRLGDGCNYGMMYIIMGAGLIIHFPLGILLNYLMKNADYGMEISMALWIVIGLLLELYCQFQRDRIMYNEMIEREKQINIFEWMEKLKGELQ